jgi:hypothetical protein
MKLLLVTPTQREAEALGNVSLICGAGAQAKQRLGAYLAVNPVDAVLVAGVCGGLDPSLTPGSLILCRRAIGASGQEIIPDPLLYAAARRALRAGRAPFISSLLLSLPQPAGRRDEKRDLWNQFGAGGVDMETLALAEAAVEHGVRWLALRAVLDATGAVLPPVVREWRGEQDERRIAVRLARSPRDWAAGARLAWDLRTALAALRQGVPPVVRALSSVVDLGATDAGVSRLASQR